MKYSVDRIENDIAVLENLETKDIIEVELKELPSNIKEKNILIYENNVYKIDKKIEEERKENILNRFNKLKKKDC